MLSLAFTKTHFIKNLGQLKKHDWSKLKIHLIGELETEPLETVFSKIGLNAEESKLRTADRWPRLTAMYCILAWRFH